MSYDLAVWEGDRPADDAAARREFEVLYERYVETGEVRVPTPALARYVAALLKRWPDIAEDESDVSPWSTGPLISEARGSLIYFPMSWSMYEEASAYAAEVASSMGLVCFDPQRSQLR